MKRQGQAGDSCRPEKQKQAEIAWSGFRTKEKWRGWKNSEYYIQQVIAVWTIKHNELCKSQLERKTQDGQNLRESLFQVCKMVTDTNKELLI